MSTLESDFNMILLWGLPDDPPIERVHQILQYKNISTFFINQQEVLNYSFELAFDDAVTGFIHTPSISLNIEDIHAIYLRPYDPRQLDIFESIDPTDKSWIRAAQFEDTMLLWSEIADARVVNRPSSSGSNASKPFQLELIRQCGFSVPATILTTDPDCVRQFWHKHKRVIYKSISSQRSIVAELNSKDDKRINNVIWCPTQFQEYIDGTDYRVHVLGDKIYASKIISAFADYRYAPDTQIEPTSISEYIGEKCFQLAQKLELSFAGIDLRRSNDGKWYCFEVNPSPGYTYFEDSRDQPISNALAEYLAQQL